MTDDVKAFHVLYSLQNELGLDEAHRDAMFSLPAAKKWQIYCSNKKVI